MKHKLIVSLALLVCISISCLGTEIRTVTLLVAGTNTAQIEIHDYETFRVISAHDPQDSFWLEE